MFDSLRNSELCSGFLLGIRVFQQAYGISMPATEAEKTWDLLREVAEGNATLVNDPDEMLAKYPNMKADMKAELKETTNRLVEHDRDFARRILEAFKQGMTGR